MTYPMRRYAIATNRLLDGRPKIASLAEVKARRRQSGDIGRNLTEVGNSTLAAIDAAYGGAGLARLITLAELSGASTRLAEPFICQYVDNTVPRSELIILDQETGQLDRYPLDRADYRLPARARQPRTMAFGPEQVAASVD